VKIIVSQHHCRQIALIDTLFECGESGRYGVQFVLIGALCRSRCGQRFDGKPGLKELFNAIVIERFPTSERMTAARCKAGDEDPITRTHGNQARRLEHPQGLSNRRTANAKLGSKIAFRGKADSRGEFARTDRLCETIRHFAGKRRAAHWGELTDHRPLSIAGQLVTC
jgi:hypothetical protein